MLVAECIREDPAHRRRTRPDPSLRQPRTPLFTPASSARPVSAHYSASRAAPGSVSKRRLVLRGLVVRHRLDQQLAGAVRALPADDLDPLAAFQVLVILEEVPDLRQALGPESVVMWVRSQRTISCP